MHMCIYKKKTIYYIVLYYYKLIYYVYIHIYIYIYPRVWVQAIAIGPAWDSQGHVDAPVLHGPNGAHVHVLVEKLTLGMCG
jgi:hypothetical protein